MADYNQTLEIAPNYADAYKNRAIVFFTKKEYDKAWDDVNKIRKMGYNPNPEFLQELQKASNRQE